ncbi:DNA cytosine methyltransferase [Gemella sp.]
MNVVEEILTIQETAKHLKVTPQYVRLLIKENKLFAKKIGKQWIIEKNNLLDYVFKYNIIIEPDDHERKSNNIPDIVALSFFSGAMGLDIGMKNAGINALLACESNKYCRMTIEKNNPNIALIGDINKYSVTEILEYAKVPKDRKVDVIFGGPPCQAFSTAGTRKALDDERGNVFLRYIEIIEEIRPKYIVIENVRGLLSAPYPYKNIDTPIKGGALLIILDRLKEAGYEISFELYNAANFGSPQSRERIIILGKLNGKKLPYLLPTNSDNPEYGLPKWKTLREAFEEKNFKTHNYVQFPEKRLKFYRMLTEGQYWKDLPEEYKLEAMGKKLNMGGGKTGFYRRLSMNKPSPTLVTNPTMPATDLCHPIEDRPLSVEEYACIQDFPENWVICGPILERYKQIGNAVPIKLAEAIGRVIIADIKNESILSIENFKYSRYKNTSDIAWKKEMDSKIKKMIKK